MEDTMKTVKILSREGAITLDLSAVKKAVKKYLRKDLRTSKK